MSAAQSNQLANGIADAQRSDGANIATGQIWVDRDSRAAHLRVMAVAEGHVMVSVGRRPVLYSVSEFGRLFNGPFTPADYFKSIGVSRDPTDAELFQNDLAVAPREYGK